VKTVVTGGMGFVGRHLVAHLRALGHDVAIVDHNDALRVDITDRDAVARAFDSVRPEIVYHLAAASHVGRSWDDDGVMRVNVEGTRNVVDACDAVGVKRVVIVGSSEQYGAVDRASPPLREDAPQRPMTPYGQSKAEAEALAMQAWRERGIPVVCVRAFNHTGPGQSTDFLIPALAARVVAAERTPHGDVAVGNLDPIRDVSDVRDVVRAYALLGERGVAGEAYNVCSGQPRRVRDIAECLIASAARPLALRVDPALVRAVDVPALVGDPSKLATATGWQPEYDLATTLADVLAAARVL
jgi:GDP-4-dehydro-6-deoxy-D-mannose reductase